MPIDDDQLRDIFSYHAPDQQQLVNYDNIRDAGLTFARVLVANTPQGPDQTTAIRKVREAVMTANAAVALSGGPVLAPPYVKPEDRI